MLLHKRKIDIVMKVLFDEIKMISLCTWRQMFIESFVIQFSFSHFSRLKKCFNH